MGVVSTDAYSRFSQLLEYLEGWYSDSVRAMVFDAPVGSHDAEHAVLRANPYPGPDWRRRWADADDLMRLRIIRSLEEEVHGLSVGPTHAGPASGLHRGTQEWRNAIATADGSLRDVARRFGVSHTEVRRLRLEHRGARA